MLLNRIRNLFSSKSNKLDISNKILVFGDSHSRAFALNPNFLPIFIGAGKLNNFINEENAGRVQNSVIKACNELKPKDVILCFGEPDTRYFLGLGWYPWENKREFTLEDYKPSVLESIERYKAFLEKLKELISGTIMVFNVTPSIRTEQNVIVDFFNISMQKACSEIEVLFIDVNNDIYSKDSDIIKQEYFSDTVHLNNRIQILAEDFLLKNKIIESRGYQEDAAFEHSDIQSKFKYDKRFGCYVLK